MHTAVSENLSEDETAARERFAKLRAIFQEKDTLFYEGIPPQEVADLVGPDVYAEYQRLRKVLKEMDVPRRRAAQEGKHIKERQAFLAAQVKPVDSTLSYREMAMLNVPPSVVAYVRGCKTQTAKANLNQQRRALEKEGWQFPVTVQNNLTVIAHAVPPPAMTARSGKSGVSVDTHARYCRELADAQRKSSWGTRLDRYGK